MKAHWPISILSSLSSLVSMALPLILVRVLDPSTLGSFKIFFLYLMVLPPLTFIAGVSNGLSFWAGQGNDGKKAISTSGFLFLALSVLSLGALFLGQDFLVSHLNLQKEWIGLFAVALFLSIASLFYDDAAIATGRIWTGAIFNSGFEILRTGVIIITAILTKDLFAIIKAHIVVQAVKMTLGYILAFKQGLIHWEWDPAVFKSVVRYAFPVSLAFVFGLWLNYSDQIILSKTISVTEFALYTVCCLTIPPLLVLESSVTRVLIPQLSAAFLEEKMSYAASLYKKAVRELSFFLIPAVVGLIVFAKPIILLLFTERYVAGVPYLRLYALWYLTLMIPHDSVARAQGQARWILGNFISFSILTLALCGAASLRFGAMGVLTGLLIARLASRLYTVFYLNRKIGWKIDDFIPIQHLIIFTGWSVSLGIVCTILRPVFHSEMLWFVVTGVGFSIAYLSFNFPLISDHSSRARKVLLLTPGLFIGGLERMILNLSQSLKQEANWQPQVLAYDFAPTESSGQDLIASFQSLEIPVKSQQKPPRFSIKTVAQIVVHAARDGVTVIHTHDLGALIYGAFAKMFLFSRVRLVHTQHSFVNLNRSWKYRYYERFFTLFADKIAVVSPDTKLSYLNLGIPEKKLRLIANGVLFPAAPILNPGERFEKREELLKAQLKKTRDLVFSQEPVKKFWLLYLARLHPGKGQDHALKLWSGLSPEMRAQSVLIFIGPETETGAKAHLEALAKTVPDRDKVIFAGGSDMPLEWMRVSDVFLSCSEFEGMPLSPVEALGCGVPAILSEIPGHEFLKSHADLYALDRPELGVQAVTRVYNDSKRDEIGFRRKKWTDAQVIRDSFTPGAMAKQYEKLYEGKDR